MQGIPGGSVTAVAKSVVIVDDDQDLLRTCSALLARRGFQVCPLTDGENLNDVLDGRPVDCVILDLMLPGVSGLELLDAISERHPDIPVIIYSALGSIDTAVSAIKRGAVDFIEKPAGIAELVKRVQKAIGEGSRAPAAIGAGQSLAIPNFPAAKLNNLTSREQEVLMHITRGASSKEIGRLLGISPRTVDVHRARIKQKLNVRRAIDLARIVYCGNA